MPLKIAACVLNQWALDFTGNAQRIEESIVKAKADGAFYCLTPELSLTSYGCGDHFYESDTLEHSWRCLAQLLHKTCFQPCMRDIICDIGMPVRLDSNHLYNCRVAFCNGQILVIRPSLELIDTGIRRESRWFTGWSCDKTDDYTLPPVITQVKNQTSTVVGNFRLRVKLGTPESAVIIGFSTCQESWLNKESRSGIDILVNASASHYEIGKFDQRVELAKDVSSQCGGGLYVWTNLQGCDSGQLCYDGGVMAALDGQLIFTGPRFTWTEVGVNIITIDFDRLRSRPVNKNVEPTEKNDSQCPNEKTIDVSLENYPE